jgi:hypothetical protein
MWLNPSSLQEQADLATLELARHLYLAGEAIGQGVDSAAGRISRGLVRQ